MKACLSPVIASLSKTGAVNQTCTSTERKELDMRFALATANPGKIKEMREVLSEFGIDVVSRDELGIGIVVEETGTTFFENALLKAGAICAASGLPAIADDSGLMVDALGGAPGVYSSSYGGAGVFDNERYLYLLDNMAGLEQRRAKFVCTIVCVFPDGEELSATGECHGEISTAPRGTGGFGFDPVFIVNGLDKTMAELSAEEKNAISHRGAAIRKFATLLKARKEFTY